MISRSNRACAPLLFLTGLALVLGPSTPQSFSGQAAPGRRYALLVGVSKYPNLDPKYELLGPPNDVLLLRDLLKTQFKFPEENITILAENQGKDRWPTRANIEQEFARLALKVQTDDQVVILMGGHGSQQPEDPESKDPKPDGLSEIFLPRDVGQWDGAKGKVANAILDHEIGTWLRRFEDRKVSLWIIFDCCHSGTMSRGIAERTRQAKPEEALGVPVETLQKARAQAADRNAGKPADKTGGGGYSPRRPVHELANGVVAFYACQSDEVTPEMEMPADAKDAKCHGVLTYTLAQVLTRAAESNSRPLTYNELAQRIQALYCGAGRYAPTPLIEGKNEERDREILGEKTWSGRSNIRLVNKSGIYTLTAGAVHGLTAGTVLAVYPAAGQKDGEKLLGQVKVTTLKTLTAEVELVEDKDKPNNGELPDEARCEVVSVDYGAQRLKLAVDPADDAGKPLAGADKQRLEKELRGLGAKAGSILELVTDAGKADWLVRWHAGKAYLVRATEWSKSQAKSPLFGPYPQKGELVDELAENLGRIARAEALKRLAVAPADEVTGGSSDNRVKLATELFRLKDKNDDKGAIITWQSEGLVFRSGDLVQLRFLNESPFAVDVTILYIDSSYGITGWFPYQGKQSNRVRPGDKLNISPFEIDADTVGLENVVIVAVKSQPASLPFDFTYLAQPALESGKRASDTPLGQLCDAALFGKNNTRSPRVNRAAVEEYSLRLLPWRVEPAPGKK